MTAIAIATESEPRSRMAARRVLVVAGDPGTAPELCQSVRAFADGRPFEALVLAPAHRTAATQWYA
jgi:hypothetical protein